MGARLTILLILFAANGCTSTGQSFVERTYLPPDAEGYQAIETETIVKNRTLAPPFGSKADSTHDMLAEIGSDGEWHLEMGSTGQLDGGDLSAFVAALEGLVAEVTKLVAEIKSPIPLEPLNE